MDASSVEFEQAVATNQQRLRANLRPRYDFIVCGSGSSGSVVARRLAETPDVSVQLIEAGGSDRTPEVEMAAAWPLNLGSARDWGFPPGKHHGPERHYRRTGKQSNRP